MIIEIIDLITQILGLVFIIWYWIAKRPSLAKAQLALLTCFTQAFHFILTLVMHFAQIRSAQTFLLVTNALLILLWLWIYRMDLKAYKESLEEESDDEDKHIF